MAYSALFGGAATTLASYTSDNGSTHSVVSGTGALSTDGSGSLVTTAEDGLSVVYVSNYSPADQDESLVVTFDIRDLGNMLIGAGIRVQPDGDGLFVRTNGFDDQLELVQYINGRVGETEVDNVTVTADQGTVEARIELNGLNYEFFVGGVSQGTGTMNAALAVGSVGYEKYSGTTAGGDERLLSVETEAVGGGVAPANTVAPVVSGTTTVGQTLSSTTGTWTGDATITYTYQWQSDVAGNGVFSNISGATASTYALQAAEEGDDIRCVVTGTNSTGNSSANSNAVGPIAAASGSEDIFVRVAGSWVAADRKVRVAGAWF